MLLYVKKQTLVFVFLLLLFSSVNAFTIRTQVLQTSVPTDKDVKLDESSVLEIDTTNLNNTQDSLLNGRFLIVPYYYQPLVEGAAGFEDSSPDKRPTVSFKVRFTDAGSGEQFALKCWSLSSGNFFSYATHHKAGETQFCYKRDPLGDGRHIGIEYRIVDIRGPTFYKTGTTHAIKPGEPQEVIIELEVRFRTGVRPRMFTDWVSSQSEVFALSSAQPTQPSTPTSSQDITPSYYIYFSDEDIDTLATYYVPYWSGQDLSALGQAEIEVLVYQTLPQFFTLFEQSTGASVQCVPSDVFSGTVVDGKTLSYVLMCSNMKKNTRYTARFVLPLQNQLVPIDFCWYVDSGGNLNAC